MTPTRFKVLKHFMRQRNGVTVPQMLQFFFGSSYANKAAGYIERTEKEDPYLKVYVRGVPDVLYYPMDIPEHSLHMSVVECFDPQNWHFYEIPETKVRPDDIVVDCGAAEGIFGLKVYRHCKELYLIEPLPKFVRSLEKTFGVGGHAHILPFAISDRAFSATISDADISSAISETGSGDKITVTTLDALFIDKNIPVSYLKADLEGHDVKALIGGEQLIRRYRPRIAITTYHDKNHADQIRDFLQSIVPEYKIYCKGIYQHTGSPVMLHAWV
ncbi:MAG TPA: FkbM family methyltransferase [Puia sp.]